LDRHNVSGLLYKEKIIDLNMGYVRYLQDKKGKERAYETAWALLPSNMIAFFRMATMAKAGEL